MSRSILNPRCYQQRRTKKGKRINCTKQNFHYGKHEGTDGRRWPSRTFWVPRKDNPQKREPITKLYVGTAALPGEPAPNEMQDWEDYKK